MTEFKIGDKVRVLKDGKGSWYGHCYNRGVVGVVKLVDNAEALPSALVLVEGDEQWLHPSELELVNE